MDDISWRPLLAAAVALALTAVCLRAAPTIAAAETHWVLVEEQSQLYESIDAEAGLYRHRVEAIFPFPPIVVAETAFLRAGSASKAKSGKVEVVLESGDQRVLKHVEIHVPLLANRDFVVEVIRSALPDGAYLVASTALENEGPPPKPGVVRLTKSDTELKMSPLPKGRSRVEYHQRVKPGPAVPGWLVRGNIRRRALENISSLRDALNEQCMIRRCDGSH
ncbi:MAG: START domain-containing protein [bacterium]|nr:START domain-containing protein [bacterium]